MPESRKIVIELSGLGAVPVVYIDGVHCPALVNVSFNWQTKTATFPGKTEVVVEAYSQEDPESAPILQEFRMGT